MLDGYPTNLAKIAILCDSRDQELKKLQHVLREVPFECKQFESFSDIKHDDEFIAVVLFLSGMQKEETSYFQNLKDLTSRHPVIVVTNFESYRLSESIFERSIELGVQEFIAAETVNAISLIRTIRHAHQRHRLVSQLNLALEEVKFASIAKSVFLAGISHELRTPLASIIGYGDLLIANGSIDETQRAYLYRITDNGRSLLSLLESILDYSAHSSGTQFEDVATFSIRELVNSTISNNRFQADEKGLKINISIHPSAPDFVRGNLTAIRQVLINVFSNAIKFTDVGEISIAVNIAPSTKACCNPILTIEIRDTGCGMSKDAEKHIFQPFFRGKNSIDQKIKGSGLGLAISKEISRRIGGDIHLISTEPGVGSFFAFSFPVTIAVNLEHSTPKLHGSNQVAPQIDSESRKRVLLVEDSTDLRLLYQTILSNLEIDLDACENGEEALDHISQNKYDLILMDLSLPKLDGFEVVKRIRAQGRQVKVIALTAHLKSEVQQKCLSAGFDDFLGKDTAADDLLYSIQKYLVTIQLNTTCNEKNQ